MYKFIILACAALAVTAFPMVARATDTEAVNNGYDLAESHNARHHFFSISRITYGEGTEGQFLRFRVFVRRGNTYSIVATGDSGVNDVDIYTSDEQNDSWGKDTRSYKDAIVGPRLARWTGYVTVYVHIASGSGWVSAYVLSK